MSIILKNPLDFDATAINPKFMAKVNDIVRDKCLQTRFEDDSCYCHREQFDFEGWNFEVSAILHEDNTLEYEEFTMSPIYTEAFSRTYA